MECLVTQESLGCGPVPHIQTLVTLVNYKALIEPAEIYHLVKLRLGSTQSLNQQVILLRIDYPQQGVALENRQVPSRPGKIRTLYDSLLL